MKRVDDLVFICKNAQENFNQVYGHVFYGRSLVLVNSIPDIDLPPKADHEGFNIIVVGTLTSRKCQMKILKVLGRLPDDIRKEIKIRIVGDGPELVKLEKYSKDNNLMDYVEFTGNIDNSKIIGLMAVSDLYVTLSKAEGLPISIIEALRSSLPVISTKVGGINEIVHDGVNGFLLDVENSEEQLLNLLSSIKKMDLSLLGDNSRRIYMEQLSFDVWCSEFTALLNSPNI